MNAELADSISIAFLVLLESLTANERAVLLLHDVFDFKHDEIANMLGKSSAASRQLLRRARGHIAENRPRFAKNPQEHEQFLHSFIEVVENGEVEQFLRLLADDITLIPDGGGQRGAAIQILRGKESVTSFIQGARRVVNRKLNYVVSYLNREPAIIAHTDEGVPFFALFFQLQANKVQQIYVIAGRKLKHISI